jgi:hypothetical protein
MMDFIDRHFPLVVVTGILGPLVVAEVLSLLN